MYSKLLSVRCLERRPVAVPVHGELSLHARAPHWRREQQLAVVANLGHAQFVGLDALALTAAFVVRFLESELEVELLGGTALHGRASRIKTRFVAAAARRNEASEASFLHADVLLLDLHDHHRAVVLG